ncbi:MAG: tRNA dihydrouridine synthase DusB [Candidatus Cloacimonetes bacterium]|nr:tRNA dihydrouridine synthase DusB [Candidatus Cloacimonadota bacterium]
MSSITKLTKQKLWLAPLAGLTDKAFRLICKQNGADVVVSEMVSSDGLVYDYKRSLRYALFSEAERPIGIQLFGSKPEVMAQACRLLISLNPDFIDINMGCPVKKVVNRGAGSALMRDSSLAYDIVQAIKNELQETGIPLSVKIRSGWDQNNIVAVEFAQLLENAGADIIIVHPRTRTQLYSGKSDWSVITRVKETVTIPVVGNGDITSFADAVNMFETTKCDSIMIGRGVLGRPWLFNEIKSYLLTGSYFKLSYKEKYEIIKKHVELSLLENDESRAIKEMRTHYCHYTKGFKGGSRIRNLLNNSTNHKEIISLLGYLYEERT